MEAKLPIYGLAGLSNEQINAELHRKIKSGKQYDRYMPYSDCSSVKLAEGNTKVAIDNMVMWSNKYAQHTKNLSVLFASDNLQNTCEAIHTFLYHHFQYKIDGFKQNLRSPACSWVSRKEGIDCKSYSIFASTILTNLGVKHYFRRIKQDADSGFTHVYVIIPKNQENPTDLLSGYFCIDGTLPFESEPLFYENDDVFVGSGLGALDPITAGLELGKEIVNLANTILQILAPFIQKILADLFFNPHCELKGLKSSQIGYDINYQLLPKLKSRLNLLSKAIVFNDTVMITYIFNELFFEIDLGYQQAYKLMSEGFKGCEQEVQAGFKIITEVKKRIYDFYKKFKQSYNHLEIKEFIERGTSKDRTYYFIVPNSDAVIYGNYKRIEIIDHYDYKVSPKFPYGRSGENFTTLEGRWLKENKEYIASISSISKAQAYINEVKPLVAKIKKMREKVYLESEALYLLEQEYQRELQKIYVKYDVGFMRFLLKKCNALRLAYEGYFEKEKEYLKNTREELDKGKHRKNFKKVFSGLVILLSVLTLIKMNKR